jgi:lysine-N-methylase
VTVPQRPRLADHVLPRRHVIDGDEHVILFDRHTGGVLRLGPREWTVLQAADGTRDLEGIRLAARRDGELVPPASIAELLAALDAVGFLAEAPPIARVRGAARVVIEDRTPRDRPIERLPGAAIRCDRSGSCCRIYATVLMTRPELERARSLLPEHRVGPVEHARFFLPVAGSEPGELVTPTMHDGACGYLKSDGACAIHAAGGLHAKPAGCQLFPVTFVDDGTSVRASVKTECACVLDGAVMEGGDPICDPAWRSAGDLPPHVAVDRLPEALVVRPGHAIDRAHARALVDAWWEAPVPTDVAAGAWAMADALEADPSADAREAWSAAPAPDPNRVRPWIIALNARASRRAAEDARWRSERDHVRETTAWIATTTLVLREPEVLAEVLAAEVEDAAAEAFYLRAAAFGYTVFDRPLVHALRDHAVRIWVSRAMSVTPAARRPLARVDAVLRAYGIRHYVDDLTTST